jgi:ABC-type transporter Mla subunit MlaD
VYLSYTANNGLPFVPTYDIKVELPQASGLTPSNQVRVGGKRVGVVSSMKPVENPRTGRVAAIAELKLEKRLEPLPLDTRAEVLSVSAVGLKYLELEKGTSRLPLKAGRTIPVSHTTEPVDFEQLFNMFDHNTREAIKINSINFGNGLAERGRTINNIFAELRPLVTEAIPVLHNIANPATQFKNLFPALDRVAEQTAPIADTQAQYFVDLNTFFTAWANVSRSIEEATVGGPPSLNQAIFSLPHEAPLNEKATEFTRLLRPSAKALVSVAPELAHAFTVGAVNLRAATDLNTKLAESSQALNEFGKNPIVKVGLEDFTQTLEIGNPLLAGVAPQQVNCNYWTLAFRNIASLESETVANGTIARAIFKLAPTGPNNEGFPSSAPANGPSTETTPNGAIIDNNHLHFNPYPNVTGPGQKNICEAGNEIFVPGQSNIGNSPKSNDNREITTREQNLFGETYPEATLKALGIKGKSK